MRVEQRTKLNHKAFSSDRDMQEGRARAMLITSHLQLSVKRKASGPNHTSNSRAIRPVVHEIRKRGGTCARAFVTHPSLFENA